MLYIVQAEFTGQNKLRVTYGDVVLMYLMYICMWKFQVTNHRTNQHITEEKKKKKKERRGKSLHSNSSSYSITRP